MSEIGQIGGDFVVTVSPHLLRVQVADMKRYDDFYKRLVNSVPGLSDVTSSFAMEQIKYTTALPID